MKHSRRLIFVAIFSVLALLPISAHADEVPGIGSGPAHDAGAASGILITVNEQQYALSPSPADSVVPIVELAPLETAEHDGQAVSEEPTEAAGASSPPGADAPLLELDAGLQDGNAGQYALMHPSKASIEYSELIVVAALEAEHQDSLYDEASDRLLFAALSTEAADEEPAFMQDNGDNGAAVPDPLEPVNRFFFHFNDKLYFWGIKPVSQVYGALIPEWVRIRIRNMFFNITMPVRFVNSLLQFKPDNAAKEFGRFLVNSTAGVAGMFDIVADNPNVRPTEEDFGQTLGFHGMGNGMYLVWPLFGPSTVRDSFGLAGDVMLNPLTYLFATEELVAIQGGRHVNSTSLQIGEYEDFKAGAIDPYISLRDAYIQHRRSKVKE